MAYAVEQDIIDRYGTDELIVAADHDGDGIADAAIITQGLTDASAEIDVYVGRRYTLPLAVGIATLKKPCVDMALYHMSLPPAVTEEKRKRYEDAIKFLKLIADGTVTLGAESPTGTGNAGGSYFSAKQRRFRRSE